MITTLDQKLAEYLNTWTINEFPLGNLVLVLVALALSILLCGLIGIERELRGRSAGLRTHLLVGVGSCIIMIISIYGFPAVFLEEKRDVARLAAQVVTGVGFLGAGAIIHHNSAIKGLTTAGTIWASMAVGIACGSFNFIIAVVATLIIVFVLTIVRKIEVKINKKKPYICLVAPVEEPIFDKLFAISTEFGCTIQELSTELVQDEKGKRVECYFQALFSSSNANRLPEYIAKLGKEMNAISVQILGSKQK